MANVSFTPVDSRGLWPFLEGAPRLMVGRGFVIEPRPLDAYERVEGTPVRRPFSTNTALLLDQFFEEGHIPLRLLDVEGDVLQLNSLGVSVVKPASFSSGFKPRYQLQAGRDLILTFSVTALNDSSSVMVQPGFLTPALATNHQAVDDFSAYLSEEASLRQRLSLLDENVWDELSLRYALSDQHVAEALALSVPPVTSVTHPGSFKEFIPSIQSELGDHPIRRVGVFGVGYTGGRVYAADEWVETFPTSEIFAFDRNEAALDFLKTSSRADHIIPFLMNFATQPLPENLRFDFIDCSSVLSFLKRQRPNGWPDDFTLVKAFVVQLMRSLTLNGVMMLTDVPPQFITHARLLGFEVKPLDSKGRILFKKVREVPLLEELAAQAREAIAHYAAPQLQGPVLSDYEVMRRLRHIPFMALLSPNTDILLGQTTSGKPIVLSIKAVMNEQQTPQVIENPHEVDLVIFEIKVSGNSIFAFLKKEGGHFTIDYDARKYPADETPEVLQKMQEYLARELGYWGMDLWIEASPGDEQPIPNIYPLPLVADGVDKNHLAEFRIRAFSEPELIRHALSKPLNQFPRTATYFGRHCEMLLSAKERMASRPVRSIAVMGVGYDPRYKEVLAPYEWQTLFPEATVYAFDNHPSALYKMQDSQTPMATLPPGLFQMSQAARYSSYFDHVRVRETVIDDEPVKEGHLVFPQPTGSGVIPIDLDFNETPLPRQKFDIIDCTYVLRYLIRKNDDKVVARAFLMQLFDALKEGGMLIVNYDYNGDFFVSFSDEELKQLGIEASWEDHQQVGFVWGFDRPLPPREIRYCVFKKVVEAPLLTEVNSQIKSSFPKKMPLPVRVSSLKPDAVPRAAGLRRPSAVALSFVGARLSRPNEMGGATPPLQTPQHFAALLEDSGLNVDEYADILEPDAFEMLKIVGANDHSPLETLVTALREGDQEAFDAQMSEIEKAVYDEPRRLSYTLPARLQRTPIAQLSRL